ncbi:MAG: outer membrane lipoprotein-sorting protein [Ignavibacteriales bacterium]|nr:outer membrane lipoprotein-sorting protein [Ignavibacteriales bacterium]
MHRIAFLISILVCIAVMSVSAQKKNTDAAAIAMMQNVGKTTEGLRDFVATIEADVDMERIRVPRMSATMYFKKPDKVHFSSSNFAMLPREGIALNAALLRDRYNPRVMGEEILDGRKVHKIELTAKEAAVRPGQLVLWIDPGTWTISRIETIPYQGRTLRLSFTYAEQSGGFLLPKTMKATFEVVARDSSQKRLDVDMAAPPQFDESPRPSRSGSISVRYLEYKLNVGLSDEIFEKRDEAPKKK